MDRQQLERLLLDNLSSIEAMARALCRRHRLDGDETDDFIGAVKLKLVENDYAVLRKFRGEASIITYLAVVIAMLMRERHAQIAGRWRVSAEARRNGDIAARLETLIYRNGVSLREAGEILRTSAATSLSDRELATVLSRLPRRAPIRPRPANSDAVRGAAASERADITILAETAAEDRQHAEAVLKTAVDRRQPEDRMILRLLFWENLTVAETARAMATPQKPLYRRLARLLSELRAELEAAGVAHDLVRALLSPLGD